MNLKVLSNQSNLCKVEDETIKRTGALQSSTQVQFDNILIPS